MLKGFSAELQRILIILAVCSLIGFFSDNYPLWMLLGCGIYIVWMLWQMRRLNQWLLKRETEHPPEASGIWGQVFDNIYQLQRDQRIEKDNLQAVIKRIQEISSALKDGLIILDARGHLAPRRGRGVEQHPQVGQIAPGQLAVFGGQVEDVRRQA